MQTPNPFGELPDASNPYASPGISSTPGATSNPLFVPALLLLLSSAFSAMYMLAVLAMVLAPEGPFSGGAIADMRPMLVVSYSVIFLASVVCVAGAIAMIRMRTKWLAWTGSIVALVPLFGPCLGFTIPLGVWSLVVLRRPDVDSRFLS